MFVGRGKGQERVSNHATVETAIAQDSTEWANEILSLIHNKQTH